MVGGPMSRRHRFRMKSGGGERRPARGGSGAVARPGLFDVLGGAARVTQISAGAGSGKTFLVRTWITTAGLTKDTAWVTINRDEHDSERFWLSVLDAVRATRSGSGLVRALTAAPDLDVEKIVDGLLEDLRPLTDPLWLVLDDVHDL